MSEDLEFIRSRIPTYRGYDDEAARHDSDMRVRAILGESLTDAHVRFGGDFDAAQTTAYDELLMQCMFSDQIFVRKFEHAKLDGPLLAALIASDRLLVELEERVNDATSAAELSSLVGEIHAQFGRRREPIPSQQ
jgi:hypothetical protein